MSKLKSGKYIETTKGFGGDMKIEVSISDNHIADVKVLANKETKEVGGKAIGKLESEFVKANSDEVDAISGCSYTSAAMKEAVKLALLEAQGKSMRTQLNLKNGTYQATANSFEDDQGINTGRGKMTLQTQITDNQITDIKILHQTDTPVIGGAAYPILADRVIKNQSLDIDAVSGATVSSQAFMTSIKSCIEQAGSKDDVMILQKKSIAKPEPQDKKYSTDIVVIGAGMAGLTAAIEARDHGANVILVEKNEVLSSSTTRSAGYVLGADTKMQKLQGIEDTTDKLFSDIYSCYKDEKELDVGLLKKLTKDSTSLNEFLIKNGVNFVDLVNVSPKEPRATRRNHVSINEGSGLSEALIKSAKNKGVKVLMSTQVTDLIKEENNIIGVKATNTNGDTIVIKAKATINCAGSYSGNLELMHKLNPRTKHAEYVSGGGNGDAYYLTKKAGGDIVNVPYPQIVYYFYSPTWKSAPAALPASPTSGIPDILLVNKDGKRVVSEDDFCFEFVKKIWEGNYDEGYCVVGQAFADKYPETIKVALSTKVSVSGLPFGYKENSIEKLAKDVQISSETLKATVKRYNELCDQHEDTDFHKDPDSMVKITAPYYVLRLPEIVSDGYTGARINENAQVINPEGEPIPGFYAAGSCADGQVTGVNYFGCGTSLLTCGVFGRAAARDAVTYINK
ncbi:FAD-dependent oxidoreductase [Lactobacillus sp. ESL0791]|uniref:FAD-dependent oxidoreductase n=1 Tax=Lactobacillus sp. ESL0791 TaxID=2983234 RepID=UPI0023F7A15D|nr:FAD-dependent oxidoreductase [Lactobacillus sp. ESL0791]MDF7639835.1 FAD-dependent oxidoreductase [Lactobacillus sp. ESL0791]